MLVRVQSCAYSGFSPRLYASGFVFSFGRNPGAPPRIFRLMASTAKQIEGFQKVYLLSEDRKRIAQTQDATLNSADFGVLSEHGLFGSDEWWAAIEDGHLPVHTVRGVICAMLMESMNDWPVFRILAEDGSVTESITREAFPNTWQLYQLGSRVIWKYVETRPKKPIQGLSETHKTTIEVWLAETVRLYRPVGPDELRLIADTGFSFFPPRLPEQPIFYPVCSLQYAAEIASKWNVQDSGRGYVTTFEVDKEYLDRYDVQQVGSKEHQEYWIPAEDLAAFNGKIIGKIQILKAFPG